MTPQSNAIELAATLLTGLLGGWLFRERTTGRNWSFAVSAAIGLLLFRASSVDDLFETAAASQTPVKLVFVCLLVNIVLASFSFVQTAPWHGPRQRVPLLHPQAVLSSFAR